MGGEGNKTQIARLNVFDGSAILVFCYGNEACRFNGPHRAGDVLRQ